MEPAIYLVSRHPGALSWLRRRLEGVSNFRELTHIEAFDHFNPGDTVCGVLSLDLAAKLCDRGCKVFSLQLVLPKHLRGKELAEDELDALQAKLVRYHVQELPAKLLEPALLPRKSA